MDLTFVSCPYCQKPFEKGDDVVVCPECGAPAHRACWTKEGHCLYEEKHASGYTWEIPYSAEREEAEKKAAAEKAFREAQQKATAGDTRPDGLPFDNEYGNYASYTTGDHGEMRPTMRVIGPEEMLGDYRVREYGNAIQKNKNRYIPKFFIMDRTKRPFVANFAAFVFPTLWSAYRRMYGVALILVLLQFLLPVVFLDSTVEYYREVTVIAQEYSMSAAGQSQAEMQEIFESYAEKMPEPPVALQINHYIILALHILMGMFGNTLYKRHVERLLEKSKELDDPDKRAEFVKRRGGTSVISAVLVAAILIICMNLLVSVGMQQGYDQSVQEATTKAAETTTTAAANAKEALMTLWRK